MGQILGVSASKSNSRPQAVIQGDLKPLRENLGSYFNNMLNSGTALTTPQGVLGSQYNALLGDSESGLGTTARTALESVLGGGAFSNAYNQALNTMMPGVERGIDLIGQKVLANNTLMGKRFSSSVGNQTRQGAQDLLLGAMQQAGQLGLGTMQTQASSASDILGGILGMSQSQLANQLPLLTQYATAFAPVGQRSSSWSGEIGFGG